MDVSITKVTPIYPRAVFLQWAVDAEDSVDGIYIFSVERSGSPEGPWEVLASGLAGAVSYFDNLDVPDEVNDEVNLNSMTSELYYRVHVLAPNNATAYSKPVDIDGLIANDPKQVSLVGGQRNTKRKRLLRRKIIRDETLMLKTFNGIELKVLKRKHFGARCTVCWDPLTSEIVLSHCTECYSTGWDGGYFDPIITYGKVSPTNVQTSLTSEGKADISSAQFTLLDYPKVEEGDLLVEVNTNRRWLVRQVAPTELRRIVVHQRVVVSELPRSNIEYEIEV